MAAYYSFVAGQSGNIVDASTYKWYISLDGATWTAISGATTKYYSIKSIDIGKRIKFEVTPIDGTSTVGTPVQSKATDIVANVLDNSLISVKTLIKCDTFEQYSAPLPTDLPNKPATTTNPQYMTYYSNYNAGTVRVIDTTDENSQTTKAIEFSEPPAGTAYMYPMRKQIYAGEMTPPNDIIFETKFKLISTSTGGGARWGIVYEDSIEKLIATWGLDSLTLFANEPTPVVVSSISKDVWHNIKIHINTSNSADMRCVEAYLDGILISGTQNKSLTAFKQINNIDITKTFKHTFFYGYATTSALNKMNFDDVKIYEPQSVVTYYVSTQGNDTWSGKTADWNGIDGPFSTVAKAKSVVSTLALAGMTADIVVMLRAGTYTLNSSSSAGITFGKDDSGTNGYNVIYKSYPGEQATVTTSSAITGWQLDSGNIYKASVGTLEFDALYEGDEAGILARYPDSGYNTAIAVIDSGTGKPSKTQFMVNSIPTLGNITDLEVCIWPGGVSGGQAWNMDRRLVSAIDYNTKIITLASAATYELGTGSRYYIQKKKEFLNAPGEFYLDKTTDIVYYYPRNPSTFANNVTLPRAKDVIKFLGSSVANSTHNIRIQGLTIKNNDRDGNAVSMSYTENSAVENCTIFNSGGSGVFMNLWALNNTVYGNNMYNIGNMGVSLVSANSISQVDVKNTIVSNNLIHDTGKVARDAGGISLLQSDNNVVSYNKIYNTNAASIWLAGLPEEFAIGVIRDAVTITRENAYLIRHCRNNLIEFNDVSNANMDRQDTGVIYSWGAVGNNINNNRLHDSQILFSHGYGIYMDDETDLTNITNNIIDNLQQNMPSSATGVLKSSMYIKGQGNNVYNNIVANNNAINSAIANFKMPGYYSYDISLGRNILYNNGVGAYNTTVWADDLFKSIDYNMFYDTSSKYYILGCPYTIDFIGWQGILNKKYDQHSVIGDPKFMDASNRDYRLKYDSTAYALGFSDINFGDIGIKADYKFATGDETLDAIFVKEKGAVADSSKIKLATTNTTQLSVTGRTVIGAFAKLSNATVTYASDNTSVATVNSNGTITAVSSGTAIITVSVTKNSVTKTMKIYVIVS